MHVIVFGTAYCLIIRRFLVFFVFQGAALISAAVNSAVNNEQPYVTGDDFSIIIPARDEENYISKTIKVRSKPMGCQCLLLESLVPGIVPCGN